MAKIHSMMDIGRRSMMNSQTALQTVGHNIANKSQEGYSRQRVEIQAAEPNGSGKLRIGTGAKTSVITRINNPYLEKQIGKEQSTLGYLQGKSDAMTRVEQVYNEQVNKGLNTFVAEFFNAFREFSTNPESLATRTQVKETGDFLARDFKRVNTQLTEIQKDIDQQLVTNVGEINEISKEIATLNHKIQHVEGSAGPANDERDRRDLLLKQLGEKINIKWAEGEDGTVTVQAAGAAILVAGTDANKLEVAPTPERGGKGEGRLDVFFLHHERATPLRVTEQVNGGSMGGLLEIRDKVISELLTDVDKMAYSLASTVNAVHQRGFDSRGRPSGDFFEIPESVKGASANLQVAEHIANDVTRIASAAQGRSPGDNRIANAISQIQYESVMADNTSTVDDYYNSVVGKVGVQSKRLETEQESQKGIFKQLQNIRESISGVSLDEETTKLIEFQKAFDASARLIRTADEMFDTVLNIKR